MTLKPLAVLAALAAATVAHAQQPTKFTMQTNWRAQAEHGGYYQAVATGIAALPPNMLDMPIEELDLPMRAYNSLKRNNIVKVGQLLQLKDDELLRMRNFGKKSLDEMKERLALRGFIVPESPAGSADESDLPAAAELDEAVAAELDREG